MTLISKSSFDEIEKNIKRQAKTRAFYTIIFILSIVFIIILGVDVANERNAGSFSRGITKVFDFPIRNLIKQKYYYILNRGVSAKASML